MMAALRLKAVLLVTLILISGIFLTRYGESGNALSSWTPSHYSTSTLYRSVPLTTCPPPPFEC